MTIKNEQIIYMYIIVLVVVMVEITPPSIVFHSSLTHTSHASNFRLSESLREGRICIMAQCNGAISLNITIIFCCFMVEPPSPPTTNESY